MQGHLLFTHNARSRVKCPLQWQKAFACFDACEQPSGTLARADLPLAVNPCRRLVVVLQRWSPANVNALVTPDAGRTLPSGPAAR